MKHSADNFLTIAEEIDRLLSLPFSGDIATKVFELIDGYESRENYFLKKIESISWFNVLNDKGYFHPDKAPGPQPAAAESYYIPYWNVLGYLERASQQLNDPKNETYIEEFLNIIERVTNHVDKNYQYVDNFYTWWSFVKILLNIDNNRIPLKIIELIPIWLQSKFGDLHGVDIATKLLPKFLQEDVSRNDIIKAERIIDYMTAVKHDPSDEKQSKAYKKAKEYKLVIDDYWLRKSFEKYSDIIGKKCSGKVVDSLSSKIRILLKKERGRALIEKESGESYAIILMEENNSYVVKITCAEEESDKYFLEDEKEGQIIQMKSFPISKEDDFLKYALNEIKGLEPLQEVTEDELKRRLHYAYTNLYDSGTYTSLFARYDYPRTEPLEVLTDFLKGILMSKATFDVNETKKIIKHFFEEDYLYFSKMALFIMTQNTDNYGDIFWAQLADKNYKLIKEGLYFGDELRHFLQKVSHFSNEQKDLLKKIIESGPEFNEFEEDTEKRLAAWKQKRYEAVIHDPEFETLYEQYKSISNVDAKLRPAIGPVVTRWGPGKSHLTKEQILQMPNEELSIFLSNAKNEDFWEGSQVRALADTLRAAVKDKPEKFTNELSPFLKNGYSYVYEILWGLRDVWKNKQSVDWKNLFQFIRIYLFKDDFWQDKYETVDDDHFTANHQWVVGEVAGLIEDGTRNDEWAFDESLLLEAEEIIFKILENLKKDPMKEEESEQQLRDPITNALNSPFGKVLNAFITYALRKARVEKKKGSSKKVKWTKELKEKYEKALASEIPEAYTLLGQYMPNFNFLDKNWVKKKIKDFEELNNAILWTSFMYGYLFIHGYFYEDLYLLMKNHYEKALKSTLKADRSEERLVQNISLAYVRGLEDITEKSFFGILIKNWNVSQIEDIISLFYSVRGQFDKAAAAEKTKGKQRIIQFWQLAYEKYKNQQTLNADDKRILSKLSKLIVFLDEINSENIEWLMLSAAYVNINFDSPHFIEHLDNLKDKGKSVQYIGKLYLKMLDNFTPDFDQEHIISTIDHLFSQKDEERNDAEKICNIYGSRGVDFLRDTYNKYKH